MEDHRSATITALRAKYQPWVHKRKGRVRHVVVHAPEGGFDTLCGLVIDDIDGEAFAWNGSSAAPAGQLPVCGNCANVARAIVEEADGVKRMPRGICRGCGESRPLLPSGLVKVHGPRGRGCPGAGLRPRS